MSLWELLTIVGTTATIFGVFITVYALINNKTLKEESRNTQNLIAEEAKNTKELLSKMEQGQSEARKAMAESFAKMDNTLREIRKESANTLKEIAKLIVTEGEKTRQTIKT